MLLRYLREQPGDEGGENNESAFACMYLRRDANIRLGSVDAQNPAKLCGHRHLSMYFVLRGSRESHLGQESTTAPDVQYIHASKGAGLLHFQSNIFFTFFTCNLDHVVASILRWQDSCSGEGRTRHSSSDHCEDKREKWAISAALTALRCCLDYGALWRETRRNVVEIMARVRVDESRAIDWRSELLIYSLPKAGRDRNQAEEDLC